MKKHVFRCKRKVRKFNKAINASIVTNVQGSTTTKEAAVTASQPGQQSVKFYHPTSQTLLNCSGNNYIYRGCVDSLPARPAAGKFHHSHHLEPCTTVKGTTTSTGAAFTSCQPGQQLVSFIIVIILNLTQLFREILHQQGLWGLLASPTSSW